VTDGVTGSPAPEPARAFGYYGDVEASSPEPVATLVMPSRTDPVARAASAVIGGPAGRRLRVNTFRFGPGGGLLWISAVLGLLSGLVLGLGVLEKQHCRGAGWNTPDQFWHACYSDTAVLYGSAGLGRATPPSLVDAVGPQGLGQPPLTAAVMWLVSKAVHGEGVAAARRYFDLSAMLMALCLAVAVVCVAVAAGRRAWDAAQVALAPVLVTVGLISYDLLAVGLTAASLLAWSRRRAALSGVLLGLAASARSPAAAVALAVLVLAIRTGRGRALAWFLLPAGLTWLGVRLVLFSGGAGGIVHAQQAWRNGGPGYGSIWLLPQLISQSEPPLFEKSSILHAIWYKGGGLSPTWTTLGVMLALVVVGVTTLVLGLSFTDRPRLAHLALFAVAGMMIVTKAVPVQAPLLLLPFIALAGFRWRDHLIWASTELVYFVAVWLYIAAANDPNKGLPAGAYLIFLLLRLFGVVWLMVQSVRAMREPLIDPVRVPPDGSPGTDDPLGGELGGVPDALVLRLV
jgi:hypothetical protein